MSLYDPRNRKEIFYRGILDGDNSLPDPQTREEIFLKAIAEAMPIINESTVKQTTGSSATDVMSQKAVTDALTAIDEEINESFQPDNFPDLPYKVYRDSHGRWSCEDIRAAQNTTGYYHYYVDSAGSDSNNGTSAATPYKTLKKAFTSSINKDTIITVAEGSVFFEDEIYGEYQERKHLIVDGNGCMIINGVKTPGWTASGTPGVYVSGDLTSTPCGCCVDTNSDNLDGYGLFKPMIPKTSLAGHVENSFWYDSTNKVMYMYPRSGADTSKIYPIRTNYGLRWNAVNATQETMILLSDINYIGNFYDATRGSTANTYTHNAYFINCKFQHNFAGDTIALNDRNNIYCVNCIAGYSKQDVFNVHYTKTSEALILQTVNVRVNCKATNGGYYSTNNSNTNNLYTAHDGCNILRVACGGTDSAGPQIADVNGCNSINIDCDVYNAGYSGITTAACIIFNNVDAVHSGLVRLCRVNAGDVVHNIPKLSSACVTQMFGGNLWDNASFTNLFSVCDPL